MHIVLLWYFGIYSFKRISFVICFWRFMVHQEDFMFLVKYFSMRMIQTLTGCTRLLLSCESQILIQKLTQGVFSLKYKNQFKGLMQTEKAELSLLACTES